MHGLLGAEVLLHVASQHTSTSQWLEHKLRAFTKGAGQVKPLIVDAAGENSLPNALWQFQWADFRGDFDVAMQNSSSALLHSAKSSLLREPKYSQRATFSSATPQRTRPSLRSSRHI